MPKEIMKRHIFHDTSDEKKPRKGHQSNPDIQLHSQLFTPVAADRRRTIDFPLAPKTWQGFQLENERSERRGILDR